ACDFFSFWSADKRSPQEFVGRFTLNEATTKYGKVVAHDERHFAFGPAAAVFVLTYQKPVCIRALFAVDDGRSHSARRGQAEKLAENEESGVDDDDDGDEGNTHELDDATLIDVDEELDVVDEMQIDKD